MYLKVGLHVQFNLHWLVQIFNSVNKPKICTNDSQFVGLTEKNYDWHKSRHLEVKTVFLGFLVLTRNSGVQTSFDKWAKFFFILAISIKYFSSKLYT